jgi:hypothetical protein
MSKPKIVTVFEYPPIPQRIFDWRAYREGDEERTWRHGWGRTEEEALADLQRIDQEMEEDDPMHDADERRAFADDCDRAATGRKED